MSKRSQVFRVFTQGSCCWSQKYLVWLSVYFVMSVYLFVIDCRSRFFVWSVFSHVLRDWLLKLTFFVRLSQVLSLQPSLSSSSTVIEGQNTGSSKVSKGTQGKSFSVSPELFSLSINKCPDQSTKSTTCMEGLATFSLLRVFSYIFLPPKWRGTH